MKVIKWILKFLCFVALAAVIFYLSIIRYNFFPTQGEINKKEQRGYAIGDKFVVALNEYKLKHGNYPNSIQELEILQQFHKDRRITYHYFPKKMNFYYISI